MHRITLSKQHMTEILYLLETIEQETKGTDAINPFVKLFEKKTSKFLESKSGYIFLLSKWPTTGFFA